MADGVGAGQEEGVEGDRIGRRPILFLGSAGMAVFGFAFFRMLDTGTTPVVLAALIIGLVLHGAMYAPQAAFIAELFPTRFRYSGASLAYQATSIFAGSMFIVSGSTSTSTGFSPASATTFAVAGKV